MKNKNKFIGVNFGGHDTSATLLIDDNIVAACEQERFDLLNSRIISNCFDFLWAHLIFEAFLMKVKCNSFIFLLVYRCNKR